MADESEVDIDSVHESIHERAEKEGGTFLRSIAFSTAILAALAAVASLRAGATVNEALVLKMEATKLQAEASDQWTYYQAKGIKAAIQEATGESWRAASKDPPPAFQQTAQRYAHEQESIKREAEAREHERDEKTKEADRLLARHEGYADSVALFQIAIALGAVAALTRARTIWVASVATGTLATALFAVQLLR